MEERPLAAVVLAAGAGSRMRSRRPKVLHEVGGRAMIAHVLAALAGAGVGRAVVVVAPGMEAVAEAVARAPLPAATAVQDEPLGTADALLAARAALDGFAGDLLVLAGDAPLVTAGTLRGLAAALAADPTAALAVLAMRASAPNEYGRIVADAEGSVRAIVEWRDADEAERALPLCNSGAMAGRADRLLGLAARVGRDNAKGERYLTDVVALARADGLGVALAEGPEAELAGVNSRAELARAEAHLQERLRARALEAGATLILPETVLLSHDTELAPDVVVGPHVVFLPGVRVGEGAEIRAFSHLEGAHVRAGAVVGPYARLRAGADIGRGSRVGNFVEVKNAGIGEGARASHLAYIGDARVGARANIGAGAITCNYDGERKHRTEIGEDAFVGSNAALVAPVTIGAGARVGAGTTVSRDVAPGALAVGRPELRQRPDRRRRGGGSGSS